MCPPLSLQVNVPRCLPFSGVGKVKQVACGGTGCAVLNGESHFLAALGGSTGQIGEGGDSSCASEAVGGSLQTGVAVDHVDQVGETSQQVHSS